MKTPPKKTAKQSTPSVQALMDQLESSHQLSASLSDVCKQQEKIIERYRMLSALAIAQGPR